MHWQTNFTTKILKRGWNYYQQGRVTKFSQTSRQISALVIGAQNYRVTIFIDGSTISTMVCNCPYARPDRPCKHMAATLYYSEEGAQPPSQTPQSVATERVSMADWNPKLVKSMRQFAQLQHQVLSDHASLTTVLIQIHQPLEAVPNTVASCKWLLKSEVSRMLAQKQDQLAFETLTFIYLTLCEAGIDESELFSMCLHNLETLLAQATTRLQKTVFRWACAASLALEDHNSLSLADWVTYNGFFTTHDFLAQKLAMIDNKLMRLRATLPLTGETPNYTKDVEMIEWQRLGLTVRKRLRLAPSVVQAFCERYDDDFEVVEYFVRLCCEHTEPERAIAYCRASIARINESAEYRDLLDWYHQLAQIYQQFGTTEQYREALYQAVVVTRALNSRDFFQLRATYQPAEWRQVRQKISVALPRQADLVWSEFMTITVKPYFQELQQRIETATTPEAQTKIVAQLQILIDYHGPTGRNVAFWLRQDWLQRFPERWVLCDALDEWTARQVLDDDVLSLVNHR